MENLIITIDGPAGSGKSTIAKSVAEKLGITFLDTGAMYRAVTLTAMKAGFDLTDPDVILKLITKTNFKFKEQNGQMLVTINNTDITEKIRHPEVTENVHFIASDELIRQKLVQMQRSFAYQQTNIVTEGRDQGTVAFPYADFKFFLTASEAERARRRQAQLKETGIDVPVEEILESIKKRDDKDISRSTGALKAADDAVIIDTTEMSVEEVVEQIICTIKKKK